MKFVLTKKDIVALNQEFADGYLNNESSLDFGLSYARRTENWEKALAYLVRTILLDHVFKEGNKRTSALLIKSYAEFEEHETYDDKIIKLIKYHRNPTTLDYRPEFDSPKGLVGFLGYKKKITPCCERIAPHSISFRTELSFSSYIILKNITSIKKIEDNLKDVIK